MGIHLRIKTEVRIDPTNNAEFLKVERTDDGKVKLTAGFRQGQQREAILSWKELWKFLFMKPGSSKYFENIDLQSIVKNHGNNEISKFLMFFVPVDHSDLVCVATRDLKAALLAIRHGK